MAYLIYGKQKGQKQFKAMDLSSGVQVNNPIYATVFFEDQAPLAELKKYIEMLNGDNQDWTFEVRQSTDNGYVKV